MTVQELIDHLSTFPKDLPVIYMAHSDFNVLFSDEVRLVKADSEDIILRGERYVNFLPYKSMPDVGCEVNFVDVVQFPGN